MRAPQDRHRRAVLEELLALVPNGLEVYGPNDDDIRSLVMAYATGLAAAVARGVDALVVELKVPLAKDADHPSAIGARAGATIGLGVQSPKIAATGGGWLPTLPGAAGGGRPGRGAPRRAAGDTTGTAPAPPKPFTAWYPLGLANAGAS